MHYNELDKLSDYELKALCIPIEHCVSIKTGIIEESTLVELEQRGFDQAPVLQSDDVLLGLVETKRLRTLYDNNESLLSNDPGVCDERHLFYIGPSGTTVAHILEKMSQQRAVLVVRGSSATECGYMDRIYGLLTISDLNRQPLRAVLYRLLAGLELSLAVLVGNRFQDPWTWVKTLGDEHQVRILGYWELTKRRGVDVGPITATTLAQLIQVIAKCKELAKELGYRSPSEFSTRTGCIPELRNCVMHPVRPLILDQHDVGRVNATVTAIIDLYSRVLRCTDYSCKLSSNMA
ncbi:MAG: hypothetical protein ACM3X6_06350 [Patescibacteria group bacterium]